MSKLFRKSVAVFLVAFCLTAAEAQPKLANTKPPITNLVPDEKTAVAIALAVLIPIYGQRQIWHEMPFRAKLNDDVWRVEGSLPSGYVGGVAEIEISKEDARVISIIHGQ
ncbi:MAG TPA: NTF2 fold immunity protein [Pseudolabrys sp.]|nr:NTF2 fold immunity protein [Pseudolabrys sp.]